MRIVFMGKSKRSAVRALDLLAERGADVAGVVAAEPDRWARAAQRLDLAARRHGLPLIPESSLYASPPGGVDLVVSFLYPRLIREPVLSLGRIGCLNYHPAPLPDFRGVGGYNLAILEGLREWGVSCHFVDENFDTGDLVEVERFAIDPDAQTAFSLDLESGERLVELFGRTMVRPGDDLERKLRAFWYPPYPGAVMEVDGRRLTLVDDRLLAEIAGAYRDAGQLP